jgi:hypothetical protein
VKFDERAGEDWWYLGSERLFGVAAFAQAGWRDCPPLHLPTLHDAVPAAVDATARLAYLDEVGVYYQMLYPNILGSAATSSSKRSTWRSPSGVYPLTAIGWSSSARRTPAASSRS